MRPEGFYHAGCLFFMWEEIERAHVTDYSILLIRIAFLGEVENAVRSGIKSSFGIMGL